MTNWEKIWDKAREDRSRRKIEFDILYSDCIEIPCPYCSKNGKLSCCPVPRKWVEEDDWSFTCGRCGNSTNSSLFKNGKYCCNLNKKSEFNDIDKEGLK
jgi:hypothetical protein